MMEERMPHGGPSALVVGGGLAGLAAATYLGRAGRRVTLLEKAPLLGGRAATDTPAGYALNRGAHALYTGGAASDVLRELGVRYTAGIPSDLLALDGRGLHRFPAGPEDLAGSTLLTAAEKRELLRVLLHLGRLRPAGAGGRRAAAWARPAALTGP
jgi:phytoene dehydrogenase-like protein